MARLAVVIPYFQRAPGILARALTSIFAQDIAPGLNVDVFVVDDQSPSPPEPEALGLERAGFAIHIVKRENGGPARARNTGLSAATGADYVAFLDSDDTWAPPHLSRAVEALSSGAQFYFANNWYDEEQTWFDGLAGQESLKAASAPLPSNSAIQIISHDALMPLLIEECLPHTSTVVFDQRAFDTRRFDEDQLIAGEDHLFWLGLAAQSKHIAFSIEPMASRGRGIDLYRAALDWSHPDCVRRLYYKLMLHKKIRDRFAKHGAARARAQAHITSLRRGILYLMIRNGLRNQSQNTEVLQRLGKTDLPFFFLLPYNLTIVVWGKATNTFKFPHG